MHIAKQELRQAIETERAIEGNWSVEVRERVCAYTRWRRANGATTLEVAQELGFPTPTLSRWLRARVVGDDSALIEVRVVEQASTRSVAVVSPSGFRVEGLSLSEAASLLREIG